MALQERLETREELLAACRSEIANHAETITDLRTKLGQQQGEGDKTTDVLLLEKESHAAIVVDLQAKFDLDLLELQKRLNDTQDRLESATQTQTVPEVRSTLVRQLESTLAEMSQTITELRGNIAALHSRLEAETAKQTVAIATLQDQHAVSMTEVHTKLDLEKRTITSGQAHTIAELRAQLAALQEQETKHAATVKDMQSRLNKQFEQCASDLDEARRAPIEHLPWIGFEMTSAAVVMSVTAGSAASAAGVHEGDKCLKVGKTAVTNLNEFRAAVKCNVHAGMTVPFTLQRGASTTLVAHILVRCISMKPPDKK